MKFKEFFSEQNRNDIDRAYRSALEEYRKYNLDDEEVARGVLNDHLGHLHLHVSRKEKENLIRKMLED